MAKTEQQIVSKWRRFARAMMPWDKDPMLAVMGGLLILVMLGAVVGLTGLLAYVTWDMAPEYPLFFSLLYGGLLALLGLRWLLRSRCPHCRKFFAAQHLATEVDTAPATVVVGDARVTGERVVFIRRYRCRRCDQNFRRRG